jgi:hypothetical protein
MDNDIKQQQYAKLKPHELTNQTNRDFLYDMGWNLD